MRPAAIALLVAIVAPASAQSPGEETQPTAPPAVRFEQKPETLDGFRMLVCPRITQPDRQADQQADKPTTTEQVRPDRCRLAPPLRERHPDYGKGKFYELTPA
jgi:hypothetical protein